MIALLFIMISLVCLLLFYLCTGRSSKHLLVFTAWQCVIGVLALMKVFEQQPALFPFAILGTVVVTFLILKRLDQQQLNSKMLLSVHVLRIPVELILFQLFLQNKVPELMTFQGWNFDIVMGISALGILMYQLITKRTINRKFFIIWNGIGIAFLLFIVSLAILSSPLPIQQLAFDQPNIAVLEFPYCYLPTCEVPIVLLSHILLINGRK